MTKVASSAGPPAYRPAVETAPLSESLAAFVAGVDLRGTGTTGLLLERARLHLLDTVGLAFAGWLADDDIGTALTTALADPGRATVIGGSGEVSAPSAALVNGTLATVWSFDDVELSTAMHCEAFAASAALAAAEDGGASGHALLAGMVAGIEVALRLASAVPGTKGLYETGFHATSVFGTLGAAAAASRVRGLTVDQTAEALALAVSFAAGTAAGWSQASGRNKTVQPGWAAHSGLIAARLAAAGYRCSRSTLEDPRGLFAAHTAGLGWDPGAITDGLGTAWRMPSVRIKRYPTGASTQATVECARELVQSHGVRPGDVAGGVIRLPTGHADVIADIGTSMYRPGTGSASIGSFPLIAARVLMAGTFTLAHRTDAAVHEPELLGLADRFTVVPDLDASSTDPELLPTVLEIRTTDGRLLRVESGSRPASDDQAQVVRKFDENAAAAGLDDASIAAIRDAALTIETRPDVRSLTRLLSRPSRAEADVGQIDPPRTIRHTRVPAISPADGSVSAAGG